MKSEHRGLTNGEVVERLKIAHRDDGLTNGAAMERLSSGKKDGGFINGSVVEAYKKGYTNGCAESAVDRKNITIVPLKRSSPKSKRKQFTIAVILVALILCAPIISDVLINKAPIVIDGLFGDWEKVQMYTDAVGEVKNSNIDIAKYGRFDHDNDVYIYISGADKLLIGNGSKHDTIILMLDSDGRRMTGYQATGLGYDNMITVSGFDGRIIKKSSHVYSGSGNDWSGWQKRGVPNVALKNNQIEFKINCNEYKPVALDAYIISADGEVEQIDCLLSSEYVGYRVYQYTMSEMCVNLGITTVTNISIACDANSTEISQITFSMSGTASDDSFGRFSLTDHNNDEVGFGFVNDGMLNIETNISIVQGQMLNYTLSVNILENETGNTFLFYIESGYDFTSSIIPKVYSIYKNYTYIGCIPTDVRIDGGFGEWNLAYELCEIENPDRLTILASDSYYGDTNTYAMALKYYGSVVAGDIIPIVIEDGDATGGGNATGGNTTTNGTNTQIIPEDPLTGEDILIIGIGVDRRVEIRGKDGEITKSVFAILNGQNWTEMGSIDSFCDERNIEFSINNVTINENDTISVISSNWNDEVSYYNHTHTSAIFEFGELNEGEPINPLGDITEMHAFEFNNTKSMTMDGAVNEVAWADAYTCQYVIDLTMDVKLWSQRNDTKLFIGIFAVETTINSEDSASVYFDTWDAQNTSPNNSSYKRLNINGAGTITYYEGSGVGWSAQTRPTGWDAYVSVTNYGGTNYRSYEFSIPISGLDANGRFGADGETIGYGANVNDYKTGGGAHNVWVWYPDHYYSGFPAPPTQYYNQPNTWADIEYCADFVVRDYALEVVETSGSMTIDGALSESEWTSDALSTDIYDPKSNKIAEIFCMMDGTYVYVAVVITGDNSVNTADYCNIMFDVEYDQTTSTNSGDKRILCEDDDTLTYFWGDSGTWTSTTMPAGWTAACGYTSGEVSYEFRVTKTELNASGNFWQNGDVIGFNMQAYRYETNLNDRLSINFPDAAQSYVTFIPLRDYPNTWGELVIPEAHLPILICIMLFIPMVIWKRKRKGGRKNEG